MSPTCFRLCIGVISFVAECGKKEEDKTNVEILPVFRSYGQMLFHGRGRQGEADSETHLQMI